MPYTKTNRGKTHKQSMDEVDAWQENDFIEGIVVRLSPGPYKFDGEPSYESLNLMGRIKPDRSQFAAEFQNLKNDEKAKRTAFFDRLEAGHVRGKGQGQGQGNRNN